MNRLLTILLLAAGTAYGQIDNPPTSVNIVDATATGRAVLTANNAAAAATAIGLGTTDIPTIRGLTLEGGTNSLYDDLYFVLNNSLGPWSLFTLPSSDDPPLDQVGGAYRQGSLLLRNNGRLYQKIGGAIGDPSAWGKLLYLDADGGATNARADLGLGATNNVTFSNITATGTLGVSNTATFSTNVTVNGNLSVGSLTTTTPSTWALDATQTAAATNGILALPSNANVIRLTNNNAISGVSGGVLGAFYYLVNQTTNAVTISNVGGITVQGGTSLTLGANQAATLVATGATNASVAARGDLNDVALGGTANTAPSQTASSGSSLMTRGLSDVRYLGEMWNATQMVPYGQTNIPLTVFRTAPMVTYTNGQAQGPFMEEFISAEKYAGKTVRLLAYCRVDSTNGGNVQGVGRVIYLTNTAGGPDSSFALTVGGQAHGTVGVFTNAGTDVFPVATSTNQYLIFTSNVGTIPTNARMIVASFGFNRASTNTTYTNNLYMHAVQLVVENP